MAPAPLRSAIGLAAAVGATVLLGTPAHALGFITALLPNGASGGSGKAALVINPTTNQMVVMAAFKNLTGNTTASHIHGPTTLPGTGTAGVMTATPTFPGFPLGVKSGTYQATFDLLAATTYRAGFVTANGGVAGARTAFLAALKANKAYLNIHSTFLPGGEISGFFQQQAPGPLPLLGAGAAFGWSRRLRSRLGQRAGNRLTTSA